MLDKKLEELLHKQRELMHNHGDRHTDMSTETDDVNNDPVEGLLNNTDADLAGRLHVDAPNESVYMICGVLIAMVLVGIIIILLAVTISKLRKREEHSNSVHPAEVVVRTTQNPAQVNGNNGTVPTQTFAAEQITYRGFWQYPPPPPQLPVYINDHETLVQNLQGERPGFCRGFRKNLGGRWRRLVSKKPATEVYTIPAELKPQLKQIYVY